MTNESDIPTDLPAQSISNEIPENPKVDNVKLLSLRNARTGEDVLAPPAAQPQVVPQKSQSQKLFEEMSAAIPQETREKINHTLAFLEAGMNQWEQVKSKGHTPQSFIESFVQVLTEYDGLRESGTDKRRAQMLTLMKIRGQIVAVAYTDLKKKEQ